MCLPLQVSKFVLNLSIYIIPKLPGLMASPGAAIYSASKHGLVGFTRSMEVTIIL